MTDDMTESQTEQLTAVPGTVHMTGDMTESQTEQLTANPAAEWQTGQVKPNQPARHVFISQFTEQL